MVHYGKHIIEPETGLCEICDRGTIHDYKKGKRPGRQFLYSNQDGKFTYRPNDEDEVRYNYDEATPRYVRKPLYPEPPPRPRPVVREEPVVQKKSPRRKYSPVDENQSGPQPRPTTFYYVDGAGQMYPKNGLPPEETPRYYAAQDSHRAPPVTQPTRVVRRRARTPPPLPPPPPPASEPLRSKPRRQNNASDENLQQSYRSQPQDVYYQPPARKAELYHINGYPNDASSSISGSIQRPYDQNNQSAKNLPRRETYLKQRPIEPVERKFYDEPEPQVARKVYKKLPATRDENSEERSRPNGNRGQLVRKVETFYPPPPPPQRTYDSSPQLSNGYDRNKATVYYVEGSNGRY